MNIIDQEELRCLNYVDFQSGLTGFRELDSTVLRCSSEMQFATQNI